MQQRTISLFVREAMRYPYRTGFAIIGSIATVFVSSFLGPLIIANLLGQIQADSIKLENSIMLIFLYFLTQLYGDVIGWRLNLLCLWTMETAAQKNLYEKVFAKLMSLSLEFHANRFGGSLVSQTSKLSGAFERFWDTIVFQFLPSVTSIIAAIVILSFIFWQYALVLAIVSVVFIIVVYLGNQFLRRRNLVETQASTRITGYVADAVTNVSAVKAHGREKVELSEMANITSDWRAKSLSVMRGFLAASSVYSSLMVCLSTIALVAAIWASERHIISIAAVYLALTYTLTVNRQLWEFNNIMRNYNRLIGDAHDMVEILDLPDRVVNTSERALSVSAGTVNFDKVKFAHDETSELLFDDLSFTIPAGQRVGLIGHSGAGKTSITTLLLRFKDVTGGTIKIDGQNIADVTQQSLREAIAYVPQEPLLFHRSLRENIAYGNPNASEEDIRLAAKQAHALEFIEQLPQGFDTLVGERGVKLSGGQRQRIAIARAILKDAPILLLDEATSALDSESEKLIQASLETLMKGRTSIVIAHRLSTIAKLDRIIVLENGMIAEDGTHSELLKAGGIYAKLWSHQSGGFIDE